MEAELFCKSDRLGLFDCDTDGLIKMTCVVRSSRAHPDWQAGKETAHSGGSQQPSPLARCVSGLSVICSDDLYSAVETQLIMTTITPILSPAQ